MREKLRRQDAIKDLLRPVVCLLRTALRLLGTEEDSIFSLQGIENRLGGIGSMLGGI